MSYTLINKIKNNSFAIESIKTMILRVIGIITLFGFTIFLTRNYDPKIIGQYDFIRTFLLVLGSICLLGTEQSILYFAGFIKVKGSMISLKSIYLKKIALILFTSSITFLLILFIGKDFISTFLNDRQIYPLLLKASAIIFFYSVTALNTETFRALEKIYTAELFRNTLKYLSVIIGAVYLLQIHKEYFLVESFLIGFIILSIVSFFMIINIFNIKIKEEVHKEVSSVSHKEIFLKSYPMAISGMAFFLLMSFDIMFLKKYYGNEKVAFYSTALKIMSIISMLVLSVNISVSTKIAEFYATNNLDELRNTVRKAARLIFVLTFPTTIIICIFSKRILSIFGNGYNSASLALIILMCGIAIGSLFGTTFTYLNMTGRQKLFQYILMITVIINFFLNKFLVPKHELIGAAISFLISTIFWNTVTAIYIYKKDNVKIFLN